MMLTIPYYNYTAQEYYDIIENVKAKAGKCNIIIGALDYAFVKSTEQLEWLVDAAQADRHFALHSMNVAILLGKEKLNRITIGQGNPDHQALAKEIKKLGGKVVILYGSDNTTDPADQLEPYVEQKIELFPIFAAKTCSRKKRKK
jgi:hypothetical protein